jgi:CDP-diacylglycerol--glycerol-3-phosphate 3-phosphatidyltransferase
MFYRKNGRGAHDGPLRRLTAKITNILYKAAAFCGAGTMKINLPNQLTISRILIAPVLVLLLMFAGEWTCLLAGVLFILAGFTDLIDGYLARRENQVTSLGKFLDPLADKVLVSSVLIMLVQLDRVDGWIAVVIICRDIMVTGLRAIAADEGMVIAADRYGKLKTLLQVLALVPLILHYPWLGLPLRDIGIFLLYTALILTVFSGCNYFFTFFRNWHNKAFVTEKTDGV